MYKVAICDDKSVFLNRIENKIIEFSSIEKVLIRTKTYRNSEVLISDLKQSLYYDIVILEIEMPGHNGLEVTGKIRKYLPHAIIIVATSHKQYAVKAYEYSVFRYILKSEIDTYLPLVLKDAVESLMAQESRFLLVESKKRCQKIMLIDIYYIYKEQKNSVIILKDGRVKMRQSLTMTYKSLNSEDFIWIERGYIVNMSHVDRLMNNNLYMMKSDYYIPISNSHLQDVKKIIELYWRKINENNITLP